MGGAAPVRRHAVGDLDARASANGSIHGLAVIAQLGDLVRLEHSGERHPAAFRHEAVEGLRRWCRERVYGLAQLVPGSIRSCLDSAFTTSSALASGGRTACSPHGCQNACVRVRRAAGETKLASRDRKGTLGKVRRALVAPGFLASQRLQASVCPISARQRPRYRRCVLCDHRLGWFLPYCRAAGSAARRP